MRRVSEARRKTKIVPVRMTPDLLRQIEQAALAQGRTVSSWVRRVAAEVLEGVEAPRHRRVVSPASAEHGRKTVFELRWRVATTYPDAPHEYVLRDACPAEVWRHYRGRIRIHGVNEKFTLRGHTQTYRYYYCDDFRYWMIGPVLNRARVPEAMVL